MEEKRTYFPPTTAQQRRLLFRTWEETGNVTQACAKAHVHRQTFYRWKGRFEEAGYEGLKEPVSHAPKSPHRIAQWVEEAVIQMGQDHPGWGKHRIADELAKQNSWVAVVSPNTVRRILQEAGLWTVAVSQEKKKQPPRPSR